MTHRRLMFGGMVAVLLGLLPSSLYAGQIYSNIGPGYSGDSPEGLNLGGYGSFGLTFVATAGGPLQDVRISVEDGPLDVTAGLYASSNDLPGALLESWNFSIPSFDDTITTLTSVAQPVLSAGTQYWFVINGLDGNIYTWLADDTNVTGGYWAGSDITTLTDGYTPGLMPGIQVDGSAVPEPSEGALLAVGSAVLIAWRTRRAD